MRYVLGIDIGGTSVKIGLFNENKELVYKDSIETNLKDKGKYILSEITAYVKKMLKEKNISLKSILGFGFGVPGPVVGNKVIRCANLGWENVDVVKEFYKSYKSKTIVKIGNDATVASLGEFSKLKGIKSLVFITLGTGVGGGIIINNQVIEGAGGSAGEIGHIKVDYQAPELCTCGLSGCLETKASIRGIKAVGKELLLINKEPTKLTLDKLEPIEIFSLAKQGDALALKIVEKVTAYIAQACALIGLVVDPEVFIIGGGISGNGDILIKNIEKAYLAYAHYGIKNVKFRLAKLKNDAGIVGASELVFKEAKINESSL